MKKYELKRFLSVLVCICMLCALSSCSVNDADNTLSAGEKTGNQRFEVHFIDVGQGDAALVLCDDEAMLIDGGKPEASDIIYTYLKKQKVEKLDYIICSHADDDHIGGLSAPLAKMKVEKFFAPKTPSDTRSYKSMIEKADEQGIEIVCPEPGESVNFASSTINFYGPVTESSDDRNNGSIVMKVIYGDTSFLFTGDAEREEEQQILERGYDLSSTVLKVGHHGSKNSATYPFLREVMPRYAVISVGDNSYGHPTEETMSRLRDAGAAVYRTDIQGDIIILSDGKTVNAVTAKNENIHNVVTTEISADICEYIINENTKKFHYIYCNAVKNMKEENKIYLNCTRTEIIDKGYEPCKQCNP